MSRVLKRSWLSAYEELVACTESPVEYNTWAAISAISSSLKNNVYIPEKYTNGFYKVFPNQYIILVGPPGVGKGTAINPAVELVKKANTANYISDRVTAEKIIEQLANGFTHTLRTSGGQFTTITDNSATLVSTELPILIQASDWMLPLLCEMWDKNEFSYGTKNKSSFVANDICVSLIAGCVPDYIRKLNRDAMSAITGGFTSRCIFVYADTKSKMLAWPNINGNFQKLVVDLIADLADISKQSGEFKFCPRAMKLWESEYQNIRIDPFESQVLSGFKARMRSHIFKTAMILSVSESNNLEISERHMFHAMDLVEQVKKKIDFTFKSLGESPLAPQQDRILKFLQIKHICYTEKDILARNMQDVTLTQLREILYILEMAGSIRRFNMGKLEMYEAL